MVGRIVIGHRKAVLVNSTFTVASGGTLDMGTFPTDKFSRLVGMFNGFGSLTARYQMGPASGTYLVSSTFVVNSGGSAFDVLNFGTFVNLGFTAVVSSTPQVFIYGEPVR